MLVRRFWDISIKKTRGGSKKLKNLPTKTSICAVFMQKSLQNSIFHETKANLKKKYMNLYELYEFVDKVKELSEKKLMVSSTGVDLFCGKMSEKA